MPALVALLPPSMPCPPHCQAIARMRASNTSRRRMSACHSGSATPNSRGGSIATSIRSRCPALLRLPSTVAANARFSRGSWDKQATVRRPQLLGGLEPTPSAVAQRAKAEGVIRRFGPAAAQSSPFAEISDRFDPANACRKSGATEEHGRHGEERALGAIKTHRSDRHSDERPPGPHRHAGDDQPYG